MLKLAYYFIQLLLLTVVRFSSSLSVIMKAIGQAGLRHPVPRALISMGIHEKRSNTTPLDYYYVHTIWPSATPDDSKISNEW